MWHLVLTNLKTRRSQVISMALTVAISAMTILVSMLLYGGMRNGIDISEQRGGADLMAIPSDASNYVSDTDVLFTGVPASIYMDASVADQIAAIDGVERTSVQFYGQTLDSGCCSITTAARLVGVDFTTDWTVQAFAHGDYSNGLGEGRVIIGSGISGFAREGDNRLLGNPVEVVDVLDESGTSLDYSIVADIDYVRSLSAQTAGYEHFWEDYGSPDTLASAVMIDVDHDNVGYVKSKIGRETGATVVQRSQLVEESQQSMQAMFLLLGAFAVLMAVTAVLQYISRFYSLVWERKSELALYRALGATRRDLSKLVAGEALAITAIGVVAGAILGFVFTGVLVQMMQAANAFPFVSLAPGMQVLCVAAIAVFFVIVAALVIMVPIRQIAKIDPASAMQQTDIG